jgi:hypothetical protein
MSSGLARKGRLLEGRPFPGALSRRDRGPAGGATPVVAEDGSKETSAVVLLHDDEASGVGDSAELDSVRRPVRGAGLAAPRPTDRAGAFFDGVLAGLAEL